MVEQGTEGREPVLATRIEAAVEIVRGIEPAPGEVLAREPLPRWAKRARWVGAVALAVTCTALYVTDPNRLAGKRWDAAIEAAHGGDAEAALRRLDDEIARDLDHVGADRARRAGAEVVRLAASRVPRPLTPPGSTRRPG